MNIIIIGATSGIGKALFERYLREGHRMGIVGRRTHLLEKLRHRLHHRPYSRHPQTSPNMTKQSKQSTH